MILTFQLAACQVFVRVPGTTKKVALCVWIVAAALIIFLAENDRQLIAGVQRFVGRYDQLARRLSSAFHTFGSTTLSTTTTTSQLRYGRRIPVQAAAAGRRRKRKSKAKGI